MLTTEICWTIYDFRILFLKELYAYPIQKTLPRTGLYTRTSRKTEVTNAGTAREIQLLQIIISEVDYTWTLRRQICLH
jgi:hypothetical protein